MRIKKTSFLFLLGFFLGILIAFVMPKVSAPFIDKNEDLDHVMLIFLRNKLVLYKQYCGIYPNENIGLKALMSSEKSCFMKKEQLDIIPKNSYNQEILYFIKDGDFYLVNPSGNKFIVSSKNKM